MNTQTRELAPRTGIVIITGYDIRVTVGRGHLALEDGIGDKRRHFRLARISGLKRLVVLGHTGIISFDALRWLHDIGAAFVHIDADGEVIAAYAPPRHDNGQLRRAQALALANGVGMTIATDLVRQKLNAQADLLYTLPDTTDAVLALRDLAKATTGAESFDDLRRLEGVGARSYWGAWKQLPIRFTNSDVDRVPDHWLAFGARASAISSPSPRRATNPANAILNYLYAVLEAEARIAAIAVGLDPALGIMHFDQKYRDSLACDLMEPIRPAVDAFVLQTLQKREFHKADFFETREGVCRVMSPLCQRRLNVDPPMLGSPK